MLAQSGDGIAEHPFPVAQIAPKRDRDRHPHELMVAQAEACAL